MIQYSIDVLAALKEAGYSQTKLQQKKLLASSTLTKLRRQQPISWSNMEIICDLLRCQPSDFLEWTPDD